MRLGLTVLPEYVQCEGIDVVLRNAVAIAGAESITTSPYVMAPAAAGEGAREPPFDGGAGGRRELERPLWGKTVLQVRTAPAFVAETSLYTGCGYRPPTPDALTAEAGPMVAQFVREATARGIKVYFQIMAAIPPGYRVQFGGPKEEDEPLRPDGKRVPGRVDNNASLAAPAVRRYMRALIRDLVRAYPEVTGFKFDWPEYPPYEARSLFFDYNPHVAPLATTLGFDSEAIRQAVIEELLAFRSKIRAVDGDAWLEGVAAEGLERIIAGSPALDGHFRLRRALALDYARFLTAEVRAVSDKEVFLQGFPPPWDMLSGFDAASLDGLVEHIGVKQYTMHWPMIEANYVAGLAYQGIDTEAAARIVRRLCRAASTMPVSADSLHYPDPDEPHEADDLVLDEKLAAARAHVSRSAFWAIAHGYGPLGDVERRFLAAARGAIGNVQLNRYGYLSDQKLAMIGGHVRSQTDLGLAAAHGA